MKKLCVTRWASRVDAISTLRKIYPAILNAVIEEKESNVIITADRLGLITALMKFEFLLGLFIREDLLRLVKSLSDYLQSEKMDMLHGAEQISTTIKTLRDARNEECFKNLLKDSSKFASEVGIEPVFEMPRSRRRKVMSGEVSRDEAITDPEKNLGSTSFMLFMIHIYCK